MSESILFVAQRRNGATAHERGTLVSRSARAGGALLMILALDGSGTAQTWEGPWDWKNCIPNPCSGANLYPEFSHAALIPTGPYRGKVLLWRREFDATCAVTIKTHGYIFDPLAPQDLIRITHEIDSELLCAGSSWDPNGRLIVVGGNRVTPDLLNNTYRFTPGSLVAPSGTSCNLHIDSETWKQYDDMFLPRFYPTIIALTKATILYDASSFCASIVGGAHLVLGGPQSGDYHTPTWSCFELLPYGSSSWACPIDADVSTLSPAAPAQYKIKTHPNDPLGAAGFDGRLSSYPRAFQLSNGDVLVVHDVETAVANTPMQWFVLRFNQSGTHKFEFWRGLVDATHPGPSSDRNYGPAVLMHMRNPKPRDRVITLGGRVEAAGSNPVASVQEYELGPPSIPADPGGRTVNGKWSPKPSLINPRTWSGAVALPDGTIFVNGGARQIYAPGTTNLAVAPIAEPEIYDPGDFPADTAAASFPMPYNGAGTTALPTQRLYHSFSLLLPDGSVFIGGGEAPGVQYPGFVAGPYSGEIFQPPYMPQTTGLDMPYIGSVGSEQPMRVPNGTGTFTVTVENCRPTHFTVQGVVLTRPGAVTHFFDNDQRYIELENDPGWESINSSIVTLTVKSLEDNLGPPGWYMLWVIVTPVGSSQRLPTHAEFVRFY